MIPSDPNMLLSFVNMKLRDQYASLQELCEDLDEDEVQIEDRLKTIGYRYQADRNQFTAERRQL